MKIHKAAKLPKSVKDKTAMNKQQIWDLLEIYWKMQNGKTMIAYHEAFEDLHCFIQENLFKIEEEK